MASDPTQLPEGTDTPSTPPVYWYAPYIAETPDGGRLLVQIVLQVPYRISYVSGAIDDGTGRWGAPLHFIEHPGSECARSETGR